AVVSLRVVEVFKVVNRQRQEAQRQRKIADENAEKVIRQRDSTIIERNRAIQNEAVAKTQEQIAKENAAEAQRQSDIAKSEKEKAEAETQRVLANDLAFKSRISLRDGDLNAAFRLAEFGHRFVDSNSTSLLAAMAEAFYHNNNPDSGNQLLRHYALTENDTNAWDMSFSPDGSRLAFRNTAYSLKVWDWQKQSPVQTVRSKDSGRPSPDGIKKIISLYLQVFGLKDLGEGKNGHHLFMGDHNALGTRFSRDGKKMTYTGYSNYVEVYDTQTGKLLADIPAEEIFPSDMVFSANGNRLAISFGFESRGTVTMSTDANFDLKSSKFQRFLEKANPFNRENHRLFKVEVWDVKKDKKLLTHSLMTRDCPDEKGTGSCAISPAFDKFAYVDCENTVKINLLISGAEWLSLKAHDAVANELCFSEDGTMLATASEDKTVKIWDTQTGKLLHRLVGHTGAVQQVVFSADGKYLASRADDKSICIWNLAPWKGAVSRKFGLPKYDISDITFSPDTRKTAVLYHQEYSDINLIKIFDTRSGREEQTIAEKNADRYYSIALSADGSQVAAVSPRNVLNWDARDGRLRASLVYSPLGDNGIEDYIDVLEFSPDGTQIMFKRGLRACLWNTKNDTFSYVPKSGTFQYGGGSYGGIAFGNDQKHIAATGYYYDIQEEKSVYKLSSKGRVYATSPDNQFLAIVGGDNPRRDEGQVQIVDLNSGTLLNTLFVEGMTFMNVCFSPDGQWLAANYQNRSVRVWDWKANKPVFTLNGHYDAVVTMAFSTDGKQLATASASGEAFVWDLFADSLVAKWHDSGPSAALSAGSLNSLGLEVLLDFHTQNETNLIATAETAQITAFADLELQAFIPLGDTAVAAARFGRADRLYSAARAIRDQRYYRDKHHDVLLKWAQFCQSSGQFLQAGQLQESLLLSCRNDTVVDASCKSLIDRTLLQMDTMAANGTYGKDTTAFFTQYFELIDFAQERKIYSYKSDKRFRNLQKSQYLESLLAKKPDKAISEKTGNHFIDITHDAMKDEDWAFAEEYARKAVFYAENHLARYPNPDSVKILSYQYRVLSIALLYQKKSDEALVWSRKAMGTEASVGNALAHIRVLLMNARLEEAKACFMQFKDSKIPGDLNSTPARTLKRHLDYMERMSIYSSANQDVKHFREFIQEK
ncbi:MAG: hypothetical protein KA165_13470, partial [Saprospiraceae bacterium]|nr:hypothetical protein [Saprospiraceae bacterium]